MKLFLFILILILIKLQVLREVASAGQDIALHPGGVVPGDRWPFLPITCSLEALSL